MIPFARRDVLLTGASGGIGAALTRQLVQADARVFGVGRRGDALARLRDSLPVDQRDRFVPIVANLATAAGLDTVQAAAGDRLALVIHAAGIEGAALFTQTDEAQLRALIDTNLLAPMLLTRRLLPTLKRQSNAAVVGIGSTFSSIGFPGFAAYSASKFGLRGFFEAMARESGADGVAFLHVSPRATRTGFNDARTDALNAALGTAVDEPADVARKILAAVERGQRRLQIGWPEKLFVRINGVLPAVVDRALARQLPQVHQHLGTASIPCSAPENSA